MKFGKAFALDFDPEIYGSNCRFRIYECYKEDTSSFKAYIDLYINGKEAKNLETGEKIYECEIEIDGSAFWCEIPKYDDSGHSLLINFDLAAWYNPPEDADVNLSSLPTDPPYCWMRSAKIKSIELIFNSAELEFKEFRSLDVEFGNGNTAGGKNVYSAEYVDKRIEMLEERIKQLEAKT